MHTVSHLNIDVSFPYAPYKEQEKIMETVIKAAVLSQNCLIDSPTGTGKTLSLLLASIAWQTSNPGSKIYFTSRTHSQLSQAMQQLKKSSYKVKIASLASRDQLCSNNIKTSFQGQNLARNCRKLVDSKSCSHYNNLPTARADNAVNDIVDIEDLKLFGAKHNACPFYLSRDNQATADLIFLPYNYIVDINSRKSQNIILKDSIIIFDEAHNIESVCCDTKTVEFTTLDLDVAISQVKNSNVKDLTLQLTKLKTEIISLSFTDSSKLKGSIICEIFDKIFDSLRYQEIIDKIDALININQRILKF